VGRTVFVGDNPVVDIEGARNAGLRTVWKRDLVWPPPAEVDAAIDDLGELPGLVQRLSKPDSA
jgi:FMN phosphatase YigB (HAD superfamily)